MKVLASNCSLSGSAVINQWTYSIAVINQWTYSIAVINQCTYSIAVINQCTHLVRIGSTIRIRHTTQQHPRKEIEETLAKPLAHLDVVPVALEHDVSPGAPKEEKHTKLHARPRRLSEVLVVVRLRETELVAMKVVVITLQCVDL
jgi:hypothetical protein